MEGIRSCLHAPRAARPIRHDTSLPLLPSNGQHQKETTFLRKDHPSHGLTAERPLPPAEPTPVLLGLKTRSEGPCQHPSARRAVPVGASNSLLTAQRVMETRSKGVHFSLFSQGESGCLTHLPQTSPPQSNSDAILKPPL